MLGIWKCTISRLAGSAGCKQGMQAPQSVILCRIPRSLIPQLTGMLPAAVAHLGELTLLLQLRLLRGCCLLHRGPSKGAGQLLAKVRDGVLHGLHARIQGLSMPSYAAASWT